MIERQPIRTFQDLEVYQLAFKLSISMFKISKKFPREEMYGLTDQLRRASRSVPANLAEGWAKRAYEKVFKRHLMDCIGSCEEVKVWLHIGKECEYLSVNQLIFYEEKYCQVGKMLTGLNQKWKSPNI